MAKLNHTLCVAPMMNHTDRHFRFFLRLLSPHAMLYTEMVTTGAILNTDPNTLLRYNQNEHPLAIQLGGSDPDALKQCAVIAEDMGYDEINLNVGCPSDRVQSAKFGACLMAEPELVAESVERMSAAVKIPVTVKSRIGIDDMDSFEEFNHFIEIVKSSGCDIFFIHARKAWLQGLSPRQNREVPPLKYDYVHQLKRLHPDLKIIINGGLQTIEEIKHHLTHVDGVMVGRAICNNPFLLTEANSELFHDEKSNISRHDAIHLYMEYAEQELRNGASLGHLGRHILGIFQGQRGARAYRRYISEHIHKPNSGIEVIQTAMKHVEIV